MNDEYAQIIFSRETAMMLCQRENTLFYTFNTFFSLKDLLYITPIDVEFYCIVLGIIHAILWTRVIHRNVSWRHDKNGISLGAKSFFFFLSLVSRVNIIYQHNTRFTIYINFRQKHVVFLQGKYTFQWCVIRRHLSVKRETEHWL